MLATSLNTNSPQVTVGFGGRGTAASAMSKGGAGSGSGGGRRRSRRSSRPKFVHVLHPGHDGRVAFVIPSADVMSLGNPVDGDSPVPGSANGTPDGMAAGGTVEGAASSLSPLPTLCPSCLPVFDPLSTDECPIVGTQKSPFPSSTGGGGGACPLVHAALDCATRHEVHRRTDGLLGVGARYEDAGDERASTGRAGSIDIGADVAAADSASVLVGMPNLPTERELVRPSTCLVTQADLCPKGASPSSEEAVADGEAPDALDDAPRHCVHWLQRGICIYGSSCRFVHCLEPSERCIAVLRSAVSEQQKQRRASNALNDGAAADSPPGVLEHVSSETPSLATPLTAMMGATIAKPVLQGQGQDAVDQGGTQQHPLAARVLPPGGIRIPGVGAAPPLPSSAQHQATPGADRGARRAPNPPPPSMAGPPAQAVSALLPHSAVMSAGITGNGPPAPVQHLYQHQPPPGYAFQAGPQLVDPAQAPQFYQHHYQQYPPPPSALPQAQHPQYPQVFYTMPPHAFVPMQPGAQGCMPPHRDSHPQQQVLWQQQLQPEQSRPPHPHPQQQQQQQQPQSQLPPATS